LCDRKPRLNKDHSGAGFGAARGFGPGFLLKEPGVLLKDPGVLYKESRVFLKVTGVL